jgi:hypothetical protein
MAELMERVKLSLYNGNGIPDNFKNNSLFFYDKYKSLQRCRVYKY